MAVCAYGALIREPLLSEHHLLNVHPSLLPRWRGAAPIERAIEAGDETTGVTIMRPTAELDAGPICLQRAEVIRPGDTYGSLSERLETLGGELLAEALDIRPAFREQPAEGVTYAEKVAPEERRLDPDRPAAELERRVRALSPAHRHVRGAALGRAAGRAGRRSGGGPRCPARKLAETDGRLLFGAASGALELEEVRPQGGRSMDAASWLRGHGALLAGG